MSFANDTFTVGSDTTLTSHTPDSGGSWTMKWDTTAATVIASEDRVRGDSDSSPSLAYHSADPATAEYDVEATARFVTGSNNGNPAIVGRAAVSGSLRNYIFAYLSKQFSSAYLQEVQNGSVSEQSTWASSFAFDTDYQLKLEIRDGTNLCKLFIDGTQRAQITADVITDKGKAGFSVRLNGRIDNWSVTDVSSGIDLLPSTGSVTVTGYAPALSLALTPQAGDISVNGYAPAVTSASVLTPGTGHVDVTGYAPALSVLLLPSSGSVDVTGHVPTVLTAVLIVPSTGQVDVTGYAPTILAPVTLTPETGQIDITGYAPGVVSVSPAPDVPVSLGGSRHRGFVVDDYIPQRSRVLAVPAGASYRVRGYAPSIRRTVRIADAVDIEIPDDVLAAALDFLDELESLA